MENKEMRALFDRSIIKVFFKMLPENRIKDSVKGAYIKRKHQELLHRIASMPILDSGMSHEGIPFVQLENGLIFYGYPPNAHMRYI